MKIKDFVLTHVTLVLSTGKDYVIEYCQTGQLFYQTELRPFIVFFDSIW